MSTETELKQTKYTIQVEAQPTNCFQANQSLIRGYQVHRGVTVRVNERPCFRVRRCVVPVGGDPPTTTTIAEEFDGAIREDGLVWGTDIHGLFDEPNFRRTWLNRARVRKGLPPLDTQISQSGSCRLHGELERWADHLSSHLDISRLITGLDHLSPPILRELRRLDAEIVPPSVRHPHHADVLRTDA